MNAISPLRGSLLPANLQAVTAVGRATRLNRAKVRAEFDCRFTAERMARDYVNIYSKLVSKRSRSVQLEMLNETQQESYEVQSS